MKTEIEVKFCQIDIDDVRQRLKAAGAICVQPMRLMRRQVFYLVDRTKDAYLRVRDEGDKVTIPSTVPPGYHTLIVSGQTPSGEDIEYEQVILVKGEDPDDIDDNGVPDAQQICGPFITPANEDEDYDGIDDACDPEVTDPILYTARNGDTAKGEDAAKLYIYRNTRASSLTGITTDYIDTSTDPDNKEALVASSLDTLTSATYNRFIMLEDTNNPSIKIPTILAKDTTNTCIALQPTDYLSPALSPTDPNYTPRGFTQLTQLPTGENCD